MCSAIICAWVNVQYLTLKKRSGSQDVTWRQRCIMNWAGDVMRRGQGLAIWRHRWGKLNQKRSRTFRLPDTIFLSYILSTERPSVYILSFISFLGDNPRPTFDVGSLKSFNYLPCACNTTKKLHIDMTSLLRFLCSATLSLLVNSSHWSIQCTT